MSEFTETPVNAPTVAPAIAPVESNEAIKSSTTSPQEVVQEVKAIETEAPIKDPKADRVAEKFAKLSQQEKALQVKHQEIKAQEAKIEAYNQAIAAAKTNPLALLEQHGLTLEQALDLIINGDSTPEPSPEDLKWKRMEETAAKVEAYEKQQAELAEKAEQDKLQAENEQAKAQIMSNLDNFIKENSDNYELITASQAIDTVWTVIERTWMESNGERRLSFEEAANAVEDHLYAEAQLILERAKNTKKLGSMLSSTAIPATQAQQIQSSQPSKIVSPTLTNTSATITPEPSKGHLSKAESLAQLKKALAAKWSE